MTGIEKIQTKICERTEAEKIIKGWKEKKFKIVFTNGCFDILHKGHIGYLSKAADLGDKLIIGLNSDSSVKLIKGSNRPIQNESSRSFILASLFFTDLVILFNEATPYELIKNINPEILVKGKDYKPNEIIGADIVKNNGGEIITIDLVEGYSTSSIIEKIK